MSTKMIVGICMIFGPIMACAAVVLFSLTVFLFGQPGLKTYTYAVMVWIWVGVALYLALS